MNTTTPTSDTATEAGLSPAQSARALLKQFQEKYPAFRDFLPLSIGIDKQLIAREPEISRKNLRMALRMHTNSLRYLKAMEKATVRFDIDGQAGEEVTDAHRAHASETLRERFKKNAEQRKAQQQAEEAERKHAEKLNQLTAKFGRQAK